MMRWTVTMLAITLAGCAGGGAKVPTAAGGATAPAPGGAQVPGIRCDANAVADLVGQPAATIEAQAKARSGARAVRRYAEGDPVTMDYRPDRLNIESGASGRVLRFTCG